MAHSGEAMPVVQSIEEPVNALFSIPMFVLAGVLLLTAVRRVGGMTFAIWQVMLAGAVVVVATGSITAGRALEAINWDVMIFLSGMFVVGEALDRSGVLDEWSSRLMRGCSSGKAVLGWVVVGSAVLSALLMNDTLAIIGTPLVLKVARHNGWKPAPLLLALAFGVTVGSVASPIGNPQNLLIALESELPNPFVTFALWLLIPTAVNVGLCFFILWWAYGRDLAGSVVPQEASPVPRGALARCSRISVAAIVALIVVKVVLVALDTGFELPLTWIAVAGAFPVLAGAPQRVAVVRNMDWTTLVFFAAMFVLMQAVWDTGAMQQLIGKGDITSVPTLLWGSAALSQITSNVPAVALSLPLLRESASAEHYMALAAGSTLAGNLFILGAASNVIVIQNAEKQGETIGFWEFSRLGVPLTIVSLLVCWAVLGW